ncbi:hypothetical protein N9N28_14505 [Rubripirellula amarantea]|nr:hypothetical protein [Rubripirellula amarantea]
MSRPTSADQAYHVEHEWEPDGKGGYAHATTIFLTASECPIGCSMCDLWQNTLTVPTPPGAIVRQIKTVLDEPLDHDRQWIKLYNSGNFFDPRSIPPADYAAIAKLCEPALSLKTIPTSVVIACCVSTTCWMRNWKSP